jgi:alginate O-acetyltransferase complex protein AlgI
MIAAGAFMKLVMADRLAAAVDKVYETPLVFSGMTLFLTSMAYTMQLLFDFAGYSYMATAVASLLGFDIISNFNLPYISASPSEFWRRWHISLSSWLRDYVYIPLGGNRKGKLRTYINIFLVMTVSGLWHGSTVNFLVWGMLHGIGQIVYKAVSDNRKDTTPDRHRILPIVITFLFVNFLWIPFRVPTLHDAWTVFTRIITLQPGASYCYIYTFIFAAVLISVEIFGIKFNKGDNPLRPLPLDKMYGRIALCILVIATAMFAYFGNGAFIYAKF